jgi:energy-coupling factor transporter ATP-binding protein EcfA2
VTISLEWVSFSYPAAGAPALDSINTEFAPGTVNLVTGALGAGCSTLLLVAAGMAPHLTGGRISGTVATLGVDPTTPAGRRSLAGKVGLLLPTPWTQLSGMAPTVADEIAFGPANHGWPRERITEAVNAAMERTGVAHLAARDPARLSGGELQRVMFAGVLAMDPVVYLLDEPALELDPAGADALYQMLPELARSSIVIVASTDTDRLADVASRVFLLSQGRCIADGTPREVLGSPAAVGRRSSTTVAEIAAEAGMAAPYPLSVAAARARIGR